MKESVVRARSREPDESQARRTERGIVAGYIHELSRRHDPHTAQPQPGPPVEVSEGS